MPRKEQTLRREEFGIELYKDSEENLCAGARFRRRNRLVTTYLRTSVKPPTVIRKIARHPKQTVLLEKPTIHDLLCYNRILT
jgi:hypothetical protein